ncbi:KH domain-containing protein [Candidatus Pacearchaeota archaeon]|nr:KH domain-containing protein [Candidatus Pacearchaeota archaeon]
MPGMSDVLREYVDYTTRSLVDSPDEVTVKVAVSTKSVIVQIKTDQRDCGKVIGKRGRTVEALKLIVLAIKNTMYPDDARRVSLEIIEEETSGYSYNSKEG